MTTWQPEEAPDHWTTVDLSNEWGVLDALNVKDFHDPDMARLISGEQVSWRKPDSLPAQIAKQPGKVALLLSKEIAGAIASGGEGLRALMTRLGDTSDGLAMVPAEVAFGGNPPSKIKTISPPKLILMCPKAMPPRKIATFVKNLVMWACRPSHPYQRKAPAGEPERAPIDGQISADEIKKAEEAILQTITPILPGSAYETAKTAERLPLKPKGQTESDGKTAKARSEQGAAPDVKPEGGQRSEFEKSLAETDPGEREAPKDRLRHARESLAEAVKSGRKSRANSAHSERGPRRLVGWEFLPKGADKARDESESDVKASVTGEIKLSFDKKVSRIPGDLAQSGVLGVPHCVENLRTQIGNEPSSTPPKSGWWLIGKPGQMPTVPSVMNRESKNWIVAVKGRLYPFRMLCRKVQQGQGVASMSELMKEMLEVGHLVKVTLFGVEKEVVLQAVKEFNENPSWEKEWIDFLITYARPSDTAPELITTIPRVEVLIERLMERSTSQTSLTPAECTYTKDIALRVKLGGRSHFVPVRGLIRKSKFGPINSVQDLMKGKYQWIEVPIPKRWEPDIQRFLDNETWGVKWVPWSASNNRVRKLTRAGDAGRRQPSPPKSKAKKEAKESLPKLSSAPTVDISGISASLAAASRKKSEVAPEVGVCYLCEESVHCACTPLRPCRYPHNVHVRCLDAKQREESEARLLGAASDDILASARQTGRRVQRSQEWYLSESANEPQGISAGERRMLGVMRQAKQAVGEMKIPLMLIVLTWMMGVADAARTTNPKGRAPDSRENLTTTTVPAIEPQNGTVPTEWVMPVDLGSRATGNRYLLPVTVMSKVADQRLFATKAESVWASHTTTSAAREKLRDKLKCLNGEPSYGSVGYLNRYCRSGGPGCEKGFSHAMQLFNCSKSSHRARGRGRVANSLVNSISTNVHWILEAVSNQASNCENDYGAYKVNLVGSSAVIQITNRSDVFHHVRFTHYQKTQPSISGEGELQNVTAFVLPDDWAGVSYFTVTSATMEQQEQECTVYLTANPYKETCSGFWIIRVLYSNNCPTWEVILAYSITGFVVWTLLGACVAGCAARSGLVIWGAVKLGTKVAVFIIFFPFFVIDWIASRLRRKNIEKSKEVRDVESPEREPEKIQPRKVTIKTRHPSMASNALLIMALIGLVTAAAGKQLSTSCQGDSCVGYRSDTEVILSNQVLNLTYELPGTGASVIGATLNFSVSYPLIEVRQSGCLETTKGVSVVVWGGCRPMTNYLSTETYTRCPVHHGSSFRSSTYKELGERDQHASGNLSMLPRSDGGWAWFGYGTALTWAEAQAKVPGMADRLENGLSTCHVIHVDKEYAQLSTGMKFISSVMPWTQLFIHKRVLPTACGCSQSSAAPHDQPMFNTITGPGGEPFEVLDMLELKTGEPVVSFTYTLRNGPMTMRKSAQIPGETGTLTLNFSEVGAQGTMDIQYVVAPEVEMPHLTLLRSETGELEFYLTEDVPVGSPTPVRCPFQIADPQAIAQQSWQDAVIAESGVFEPGSNCGEDARMNILDSSDTLKWRSCEVGRAKMPGFPLELDISPECSSRNPPQITARSIRAAVTAAIHSSVLFDASLDTPALDILNLTKCGVQDGLWGGHGMAACGQDRSGSCRIGNSIIGAVVSCPEGIVTFNGLADTLESVMECDCPGPSCKQLAFNCTQLYRSDGVFNENVTTLTEAHVDKSGGSWGISGLSFPDFIRSGGLWATILTTLFMIVIIWVLIKVFLSLMKAKTA